VIFFLYHLGGVAGLPTDRSHADQILGYMFSYQQVLIDAEGLFEERKETTPLILRTVEEARAHPFLKDLRWIYMDPQGRTNLQEFDHPDDNAVYCFGSDWYGHGRDVSMEETVRVALPDPDELHTDRVFFVSTMIPIVAYDRALKTWQRRHSSTI
jgi:hypothetical protein